MKRTTSLIFIFVAITAINLCAQEEMPLYKDAHADIESRVSDLLSRMTVEEKVGQLMCPYGWPMYEKTAEGTVDLSERFYDQMHQIPFGNLWGLMRADPWTKKTLETGLNPKLAAEIANKIQKYAMDSTRLGIPIMMAEEAPHGHMAIGSTCFPTALMLASTFDKNLLWQYGTAVGEEVRSQGGHVGYGPVVDIAREPRWGRVEETYGEDPYLTGTLATAIIRGEQGSDIKDGKHIYSTLKHFVAYGIPEGGLNSAPSQIGERTLFSEYTPQFKMAVEAGVEAVMTSYNSIDGIPCTANRYLITEVLREQWGFKGMVYSDLGAIENLGRIHGVADDSEDSGQMGPPTLMAPPGPPEGKDRKKPLTPPMRNSVQSARLALEAGVDIDLNGSAYRSLVDAIKKGKIEEALLDRSVSEVLRHKFKMGLFENPFVDPDVAAVTVHSYKNVELARQIAREGVVLLKNDGILPLDKNSIRSIAVIGPNADEIYNQLGDYTAPQVRSDVVTVLDGIKMKLPSARINYIKGCAIRDTKLTDIKAAVKAAKKSDVTVLVIGGSSARDFQTKYEESGAARINREYLSDMESGEGYDRSDLCLMGDQEELMEALMDAGVKLVVVYIEGRPLNMNLASERANALCTAWYPGCQGGIGIADVLFGDYNPSGRLPIGIPRSIGQIPVYYSKGYRNNYLEGPSMPLYVFGYGLSYTTFEYSDLKMEEGDGKDIYKTVSCTVTNTGSRDGDEVVQLYIKDQISSVVTPAMLLKGFERITLKKGESRRVSFKLGFDELSLYNLDMKQVVEPGKFNVMIGSSSSDIKLQGTFEVR